MLTTTCADEAASRLRRAYALAVADVQRVSALYPNSGAASASQVHASRAEVESHGPAPAGTSRLVLAPGQGGGGVRVVHYDSRGTNFHAPGVPAVVEYRRGGSPGSVRWYQRGALHRSDGPASARLWNPQDMQFWHLGTPLRPCGDHERTAALFADLVAFGLDARCATAWLRVREVALGPAALERFVAAGARPEPVLAAARAGVVEHDALLAVATRRAPTSWAART